MKPKNFYYFLALFLSIVCFADARTLRVAGSDYIPERLIRALEDFAADRGDELDVTMKGSLLAQMQFEEGKVDISLVSLPGKNPEDFPYPVLPIGYQISVLAVNRALPIEALNRRQLSGIFSSGGDSVIARWSDIGLPGEWRGRNIQAGYTNPRNSPALQMFRATVLNNEPFRSGVQQFENNLRLESFINNNESAIGLLSSIPLSGNLKTIRIESEDGTVAFGPTLENVNYGDYPLSLPYFVCVPLSQYRTLTPYIRFLLSDEIAMLLQEEGFMPILSSIRERVATELPNP